MGRSITDEPGVQEGRQIFRPKSNRVFSLFLYNFDNQIINPILRDGERRRCGACREENIFDFDIVFAWARIVAANSDVTWLSQNAFQAFTSNLQVGRSACSSFAVMMPLVSISP